MNSENTSNEHLLERRNTLDNINNALGYFIKKDLSIKDYEIGDLQEDEESVEEIVNTRKGLCVLDQKNRLHLIWSCGIKSITRYSYHPYIGWSPSYLIRTNDPNKAYEIFDSQIGPKQTVVDLLTTVSGVEIKKYRSQKRTNDLLLNFLSKNAGVYYRPLHCGWQIFNGKWFFMLLNEMTHHDNRYSGFQVRIASEMTGNCYDQNGLIISGIASRFTYLENSLKLIKESWIRRKLWLYIHAASVCSLLKQSGISFDTGLCIYSDSLKVRKFMEEFLDIYNDIPASLSDSRDKLANQIILAKDQLLLIRDEDGAYTNERYFRDLLRTGEIKSPRRNDQSVYMIQAVPTVISDGRSKMKDCEKLNHLTIDESDLEYGAIEKLKGFKQGIKWYIESFIVEVAHDAYFIQTIQQYIDLAFEQTPQKLRLRRDAVITIGVLNGIRESLSKYYGRSSPYGDMFAREYLQWINPEDYGNLYQQVEDAGGENVDLGALFFAITRSMIEEGKITIMRRNADNHFCYRESNPATPEIMMDTDYTFIPSRAFSRICELCQVRNKRMARALDEKGLLFAGIKSQGTYEARLTVHPDNYNSKQIYVYQVETWRLKDEESARPVEDCDYDLQLGKDINGRERRWDGDINSHIRITGMSGTGKSYLLRYLAGQLPAQGVKCIIFDSSGDFSNQRGRQPQGWPAEGMKVLNMKDEPIELLPFTPRDEKESAADVASRISSTISVALGFGKRQNGHLTQRIAGGLQSGELKEFKDLKELLHSDAERSQSAKSVYSAMDGLWDVFPANVRPFDWEFDKPGITIINLHEAYSEAAEKIVVEMLLGELYSKRMRNSMAEMPHLVLVMDECQRLCWNEDSFASKLMKESRKFGISIWAGTQNIGKKTLSQALGQCGLQIAFMPDGNSVSGLAKELTGFNKILTNKCIMRLRSLERGQFLYVKNGEIVVASAP